MAFGPLAYPCGVIRLETGERRTLRERARATSSPPLGTTFDQSAHILDPATGMPAPAKWRSVSASAPSAAIADALVTAACLLPDPEAIDAMLKQFAAVRLDALGLLWESVAFCAAICRPSPVLFR